MESNIVCIRMEELGDITTCCICTEFYTDPKALPCIHTFCMKCIQETGFNTNKGPGDEMPCPICRRLFKIPEKGFHRLPKNFLIERLIQVLKFSDQFSTALCSVCLEKNKKQKGTEIQTADAWCVNCRHKLCKGCSRQHDKFKSTTNHKVMPVKTCERIRNMIPDPTPMFCEIHEENVLEVYCADCKAIVCLTCFTDEHKGHEGSHVIECVDDFRRKIQRNTEKMNACITQAQTKRTELVRVKEQLKKRVKSLEWDVVNRKEQIKHSADEHANRLLQGLCSERQSRSEDIKMATYDIDAYLSYLESHNSYYQQIMTKGSAGEVCRALISLSVGEIELQQQCQEIVEQGFQDFKFCFRPSELEKLLDNDCGNLIGEIVEEGYLKPKKRDSHILLAVQSKEMDILRQKNGELKKERADFAARIEKQKQELENSRTTIHTHQLCSERLKQLLQAEKTINALHEANSCKLRRELYAEQTIKNSLLQSKHKFLDELDMYRTRVKNLEMNAEKLQKELKLKTDELRYKSDPVLVQTIRTKAAEEKSKDIRGLTILDKELFVVSQQSSDIEVYDSMKLSLSRRWTLTELNDPLDIGSCSRHKYLFIFDYKGREESKEILRVDPSGNLTKRWSTGNVFGWGLSVTKESNVIVTAFNRDKLEEFSPDGQLIREINISSDAGIQFPWHAIKLANGNFVISHGVMHRVCIVDEDGKLDKSFDGEFGASIGQMNGLVYLFVIESGFVMVIDRGNKRVLLLNSDLEFKKEILTDKHGLRFPWRILLDETNHRLIVADNESDNQKILVFDFR